MIALSPRNKLIGGAFGLAALVWGIDLLTGGPDTRPASAAPTTADAPPSVALPPDPSDLDALIESLQVGQAGPPPLSFDHVQRDLFVPTPTIQVALEPVVSERPEDPEPNGSAAGEPRPFEARHRLQGVLTGRVPLALIDGQLFRQGAEIDGYRMIELDRDCVVFQRGSERVVLHVPAAGAAEQAP